MPRGSSRFRLITLGRLALVGADGTTDESLQKRRRKLAVLAWLAIEGRPRSRDAAIGMFWGEHDEASARHALSDAISHLRRVLGRDAITGDRAELALGPAAPLSVDAIELARAAAAGEFARVIALYTGPFLDSVYVEGSATFEHWVTRERARLEALFLRACRSHCAALSAAGECEECAAVAARWLDADPLSPDAAIARIHALDAPGTVDSALAALAEYGRLEARLAREFEVQPSAEVRALAASIGMRARTTPAPAAAVAMPASPELPVPRERRPMRSRRAIAALAIVLAAASPFLLPRRSATALSPTRVAVLPFTVHGTGGAAYLREGLVDLLSASLDGAGTLHSTDPRAVLGAVTRLNAAPLDPDHARDVAAAVGAGMFVLGEVFDAGGALRVDATLYDAGRDAMLSRATADGPADSLFAIVDRLTAQILAHRSAGPADRLQRVAAMTTPSLGALKAWLQGEEQYRTGHYAAAFESFQHAIAEDQGFSLAHYRLAKTATWAGIWSWDSIVAGSGRAVRHDGRLARRQKLLVEAFDAWMRGDADAAESRYRQVVASAPDEVEGWYELGEVLFHCNPLRGRPVADAREAFERTLALEPGHRGALVHLMRISAMEGKRAELDSLVTRALAVSGEDWGIELRAFRVYAVHDTASFASTEGALRGAQDAILERTAERTVIYVGDWDSGERLSRMMAEKPRSPEIRARGELFLADLAIARGQWRAAAPHFAAAERAFPRQALIERARLLALPFSPATRLEVTAMRDSLRHWDGSAPAARWPSLQVYGGLHPAIREYLIGLLSVRIGDARSAADASAHLDALAGAARGGGAARAQEAEFARGLASAIRAHLAISAGRREEALAHLDRARLIVSEGLLESAFGSQAHERWARAELLRESGRLREALGWYRSIAEVAVHGAPFLAPAELRQGEIEERLGDRRRAAAHYRAVVERWRAADPAFRPLLAEATKGLERGREEP